MKKILYFLLLLVILPINVYAAGDITTSVTSLTVEKGSTETFELIFDNAIGLGKVSSSNTSVATVGQSTFATGAIDGGKKVPISITVTGVSVGTANVVMEVTDGALFTSPATDVSGKKLTVQVNVVAPITKYTVSFNTNGGSAVNPMEVNAGDSITLPSTSQSGYTFVGWYTDSSLTKAVSGTTYKPTADTTLYAKWQAVVVAPTTYTVTYNANGGNVTPSQENALSGVSVTLPTPTYDGQDFLGWYTAKTGGTKVGDAGSSYTVTANIVLYARWQEKAVNPTTYTVKYDANGGDKAPGDQVKTKDETLTLSNVKPVKDKFKFVSWNTKKDGTGDTYEAGGKYTKNADVVLYAQWKSVEEVDKNPQTGDSTVYIIFAVAAIAGIYSYWYNKKTKEN